jgi:hypothetical protein
MSQNKRILIGVAVVILVAGGLLGLDALRRARRRSSLPPGSIPIYVDGRLTAHFTPEDLDALVEHSFVDEEEGKTQKGWALREILPQHVDDALQESTEIVVSSSSRDKSVTLTWAEVADPENHVIFDLSGRGTLKLVSVMEKLDTRDEWVQDTDKIEITTP